MAQRAYDQDKALFDFDESVNNLSEVSDRYAHYPADANALQGEELHSTEEQGKAKEAQLGVQNEERFSPRAEHCRDGLQLARDRQISAVTPKLEHTRQ